MKNLRISYQLAFLIFLVFAAACTKDEIPQVDNFNDFVEAVASSDQRNSGDPEKGYDYLIYGDYISSGFPYDFFISNFPKGENVLNRNGINTEVAFSFNAVQASNGVNITAPNCLQCHAQYLDGEFILGLGNYASDYTFDQSTTLEFADLAIINAYGVSSLEWEAYEPFSRASKITAPHLVTEVKGVNPADKLTAVLGAHRDSDDLTWLTEPQYNIPEGLIPTDVPPLWLVKKKNTLYYTGSGRGDHARLISAAELLTLPDVDKAREVDEKFIDVYAFLKTLEAPSFPKNIDERLAAEGEEIFLANCAKCHGTYGTEQTYPNLLVDVQYVGTDPELANANFAYADFLEWYNRSWYNTGEGKANFEKTSAYIAPPLDGIWATAPYLHNASIPNLETLLNSETRPDYWKRSQDYDLEKLGWKYNEFNASAGSSIYDTTIKGYGNEGHTFGDALSIDERRNLMEYLKTL